MEKIFSFDGYMLEMLSESAKNDELNLKISDRLRDLLKTIKHPIADDIIINSEFTENEYKITFIDIDDSDSKKKDMVSFFNSNKVVDKVMKDKNIKKTDDMTDDMMNDIKRISYRDQSEFYDLKSRSTTKIGRIVGKLFPGKYKQSGDPGKDIESFVNMFKASRDTSQFEVVSGDDIKFWYNEEQYKSGGGQLNSSCMRYDSCEDYLDIYTENEDKVSLVILKDPEDDKKIRGRAILWELDRPSGRTFMDRIYTVNDSDVILFKEYAKENGWMYKKYQNMDEDGPWVDTKNDQDVYTDLVVHDLDEPSSDEYPYCDTMKYYDGSSISNDKDNVNSDLKKLEDTSGGWEEGGIYSDFYEENIDEDDMIYCDRYDGDNGYRYDSDCFYSEFYEESICDEYAKNNMEELDHYEDWGDRYRDSGDYITTYEGNSSDEDYASNNFSWSEYHGEYLEEGVYSEYHEGYIHEDDSVEVYIDAEKSDTDWRISGDGGYWEWDHDFENYDDDVTEEELREYNELDEDED